MVHTPDCLAPGNTPVPDVTCGMWKPTDVPVPACAHGWLITAWDFPDTPEYGRRATLEEWKAAMAR